MQYVEEPTADSIPVVAWSRFCGQCGTMLESVEVRDLKAEGGNDGDGS